MYRKDRRHQRRWSSRIVYISEFVFPSRRRDLEFPSREVIWWEIKCSNTSYLLCTVYRPNTSVNPFWEQFKYSIEEALEENPNVIIVGTLNHQCWLAIRNSTHTEWYHLTNTINQTTRVCRTRASLLDPVLVSEPCKVILSDVIPIERDISDHDATSETKCTTNNKIQKESMVLLRKM